MPRIRFTAAATLMFALIGALPEQGLQAQQGNSQSEPYAIEYYYKARWGFAAEFLRLYKKNHHPVLKKEMELGRILEIKAEAPRYHATEDGRWDYRVTIVYRNASAANQVIDLEPILRSLYPDRALFDREEQRRFEILEAHWDVPVTRVDLTR
jgi:hypothetical protein